MKAKISLGSGGIKGLIVKHVEKAVVAFAVLFFFLLVWRSSKLGGNFDLQPDELQTTSVEADKAIREPKKGPDENVPPWERISTELRTPIPAWPYSVGKTWMHRLFPGETLRGQPVVFPIEELRGSTGFGGIALKPATAAGGVGAASPMGPGMPDAYASEYGGSGPGATGAGGNVEGRRWVVVTGLLPYKKQWVEYGNVFRNAEIKDPRRDVPAYNDYDVQRAEVTPGVEPAEEDWQPLNVPKEFFTRTSSWAGSQPEIVHPKFIHRSGGVLPMVFPLPPLVSKTFDAEIAHEPEIPLFFEIERKVEEEEIDWEELAKDPEALLKARTKLRRSQSGGSYGGAEGMYGGSADMYGSEMTQDYGGSSYGMEGSGMMSGYDMAGSGGYASAGPRRDIPEYQLFRFFDFSVLPGRYYQYRVRARLANPNHEMPPQHLENEELAKQMLLQTDWSAATKVVNVPLDSRVLAGPVSVPANVTSPPTAELGTVFFNAEDGEEVAEKFTIKRGVLMNFPGRTVKEEEKPASLYGMEYGSEYMTGSGMDMYGPQPKQKPKKQEKEEVKTVDYVTEMLVLDLEGGDSFPGTDRNLKGPGRALLMDPAGNLVLQQELTDQEEWTEFFPPEVKKKEVESPYGMEGSGGYMVAP